MRKSFDELTIADDYMFYRVMENTDICKTLLNIVLHNKTDTITDIQLQRTVSDAGIGLADGITKIIINSKAAGKEANPALKTFLQYMNGKVSDDNFIRAEGLIPRRLRRNEGY